MSPFSAQGQAATVAFLESTYISFVLDVFFW